MFCQFDLSLIIVDLDNTLYAADNGVFSRMDQKMNTYIRRELQVSHEAADELRVRYWKQYGSTLKGLMKHHNHDAEPFLFEAHDIDAFELLDANPSLQQTLASIKQRKVIHTNGTREHAETILSALGIQNFFSAIYDIRFNQYTPKPCAQTLRQIIDQEQVDSQQVLVVDDMQNNLSIAKQVGAKTAWVHPQAEQTRHSWDIAATSFQGLLKS